MQKVNWIIHAVFGNRGVPKYIMNFHTHGMEQYGHLDFQLVINLGDREAKYLLNTMGMRVQAGEKFAPGDMVEGLYEDCNVRLDSMRESGRDVLRLIIPDKYNRFPEDPNCLAPYKYQTRRYFGI